MSETTAPDQASVRQADGSMPSQGNIEASDAQTHDAHAPARRLHVVADATTAPLLATATKALEAYGASGAPQVERVATSAAFARICSREGWNVAITTRRIRTEELEACGRASVWISEGALGRQAVVLTAGRQSAPIKLSARDVYRALARQLPAYREPGTLTLNQSQTWHSVNEMLEFRPIEIIGPPLESAQGQALVHLLMEPVCDGTPWVQALKTTDYEEYRRICHSIREDGVYVEAPQTAALVTRLWAEPYRIAVVDYSFYEQHRHELAPSLLSGPEPNPLTLESGGYPAVRMLYAYASEWHVDRMRFLQELFGERALGPNGYLRHHGLRALDDRRRLAVHADVVVHAKALKSL